MIQVNELRVGNLVNYGSIKLTVTHTSKSKIVGVTANRQSLFKCYYDEIDPIAITEEWLLKFGFLLDNERIKSSNYVEYAIGNFILASHNRIDYWILLGTGIKIKSVHELQNAYHFFKGLELTK